MFKNIYFKLGLISTITALAVLITLPRIPIVIKKGYVNIDSSIGGYYFRLFNDKFVVDLRDFKKGLDLKGGIKIVLRADTSKIADSEKDNALEAAREVISRRVNLLGVTEPNISTVKLGGEARIIVEIPGIENVGDAIALIGETAQLKFKVLKADKPWSAETFSEYYLDPTAWEDSGITGADLKGVDVVVGDTQDIQSSGKPQIRLRFTNEGRNKFSELAKQQIGKPVGLFLDEDAAPLSMPVVSADLADGLTDDPVISGDFTFETAKNLSIQIRAGALPIPVEVLEQETIGATLGSESIDKSFFAGLVGLALVLIFMIYKYGKLGLLSGIALSIYSVIVLAIFKTIPVVLTLPGIAGFVLSIGMATDANILIFERINEELYWNKPRNLAIKLGFERAWNSIRDSNISSLITSFILFQLGSGPVRGFALTLAIGILVSLFTSIFVVKVLIEVFNIGGKHA